MFRWAALAGTVSTALFAPDDQALSQPMLIFPSLAGAYLVLLTRSRKFWGTGARASAWPGMEPRAWAALGWKTWLRELDVAPVEELSGCDFVLEVGSAGGTHKAAGAAALNDWVLATSVDL
jgi:hypothetical protein